MGWHIAAGVLQLVLTVFFLVTRWRARRSTTTLIYVLPMAVLAVGVLLGARWAIVVSAVFYSAWLLNELLWWVPFPLTARRRRRDHDLGHVALGLQLAAVTGLSWYAAVAAYR
jgi:hypothetical protein